MEFVDTHCHLQFSDYLDREDAILAAASKDGVKQVMCVGTALADSKTAVALAARSKDVWATVGVHPHESEAFMANVNSQKKLTKLAGEHRVVAIGETGLDFYRQHSGHVAQEQALRIHLKIAQALDLPLIFHVRDAWKDFWRIIDEHAGIKGVVHSFSSGPKQLDAVLNRGLYVGLNGIMTFTKDQAQLEAAKKVPLDNLLLETDAPFLTPEPYRGQTCEPKHVRATATFLAELRGEPLEEVAERTTKNAQNLFGLAP